MEFNIIEWYIRMKYKYHSIVWLFYLKYCISLHTLKSDETDNGRFDRMRLNGLYYAQFHRLFTNSNNKTLLFTILLHSDLSYFILSKRIKLVAIKLIIN